MRYQFMPPAHPRQRELDGKSQQACRRAVTPTRCGETRQCCIHVGKQPVPSSKGETSDRIIPPLAVYPGEMKIGLQSHLCSGGSSRKLFVIIKTVQRLSAGTCVKWGYSHCRTNLNSQEEYWGIFHHRGWRKIWMKLCGRRRSKRLTSVCRLCMQYIEQANAEIQEFGGWLSRAWAGDSVDTIEGNREWMQSFKKKKQNWL